MRSESADLARPFCAAWSGGDVETIVAFFACDAEWENVPIGILHGRDAARERITAAFANARAIRWYLSVIATSANGAIMTDREDVLTTARGEITFRIMGPFRVSVQGMTLWRDHFDARTCARHLERGRSVVAG